MTEELPVDSGNQAPQAWLLGVQRKLYQWSRENPGEPYCDLWNWVTDPRNLHMAWRTIAGNRGKRTPGVDGATVEKIATGKGVDLFLHELREELRSGDYRPSPARRKWMPKPGKPGKNLVDTFPGVGPGSRRSDLSTGMGQKKPDELHSGIAARAENGYLGGFHGYRFWMAGKSRLANAE